jgi:two-component system cell cycle sensor histidine kinase/response regulator CckA
VRTGDSVLEASELSAIVAPAGLAPGPHAWLEIRDDGPGIDPHTRSRLFERGFSTKGSGRGHGLSEVWEILLQHRGGLLVSSRPSAGAAFRIFLPIGG